MESPQRRVIFKMIHEVLHKKRIMRQMEMEKTRKISPQSPSVPRRRKRKIKLPRRSKNHSINQTIKRPLMN